MTFSPYNGTAKWLIEAEAIHQIATIKNPNFSIGIFSAGSAWYRQELMQKFGYTKEQIQRAVNRKAKQLIKARV